MLVLVFTLKVGPGVYISLKYLGAVYFNISILGWFILALVFRASISYNLFLI